jgi:hypothetical protein
MQAEVRSRSNFFQISEKNHVLENPAPALTLLPI